MSEDWTEELDKIRCGWCGVLILSESHTPWCAYRQEGGDDPLNGCAPPGQVHPFYARMQWVIEWVNGYGPLRCRYDILIRVMPVAAWKSSDDLVIDDLVIAETWQPFRMTRHKAMGRAPYVGCPFVYTWNVGVDNFGRQVAGESRIKWLPMEPHKICDGTCWADNPP